MADILCKLKLVTDNYEKNIKKSKQSMADFDKTVKFAGVGVTKFLGILGAGVTAGEVFNKMIHSSQTLGDAYTITVDSLTGAVDTFFYSVSNGDWTPFLQGLSNTIELAKRASTALDQLGNTKMSYGYFNTKNQAELQDQIAILRDEDSTEEQKKAAKEKAEKILADQKEITEQLSKRSFEAMTALVQKSTGFEQLDVSQMDLEKVFRLDVSELGDEDKKRLSKLYKEFELKAIDLREKNKSTTSVYQGMGGFSTKDVVDHKALAEDLKPLLAQYQDAIIYNSTLVRESDDWLNNLMQIGEASFVADRSLASMTKSMNRASQSGSGKKDKKDDAVPPAKGSIDYINAQISDLTKKLNAATDEATRYGLRKAIEGFNKEKHLIELEAKIKPLEGKGIGKVKGKMVKEDIESGSLNIKPVITKGDVKVTDKYNEALSNTLNMMLAVSNATNDGAAGWITYGVNAITALNGTYQALAAVIPALQVKALVAGAASAAETPIVGWITAIAAIGAMTAAFMSLPKYENGGMVGINGLIPGSSFSGDQVLVRANSGELILNKAQQKNIASQLTNGSATRIDVNVVGKLSGRDIELVIDKRNQYKNRVR